MLMAKIFQKPSSIKLPQPDGTDKREEYWHEHKGTTKCPQCRNVHLKKRWYASEYNLRQRLRTQKVKITETKLCPACKMENDHTFEGEVFIENFSNHDRDELLNLVYNFGQRATDKDPQDRIID